MITPLPAGSRKQEVGSRKQEAGRKTASCGSLPYQLSCNPTGAANRSRHDILCGLRGEHYPDVGQSPEVLSALLRMGQRQLPCLSPVTCRDSM